MSSRFIPLNIGEIISTKSTNFLGSFSSIQIGTTLIPASYLKMQDFPFMYSNFNKKLIKIPSITAKDG